MLKFGDVSFDLGFERGRMSATGYVAKISMLRLNIGSGKLSSCMLSIGRGPKAVQGKGGGCPPLPCSHLGPRPMLSMHELSLPEPMLSLNMLILAASWVATTIRQLFKTTISPCTESRRNSNGHGRLASYRKTKKRSFFGACRFLAQKKGVPSNAARSKRL